MIDTVACTSFSDGSTRLVFDVTSAVRNAAEPPPASDGVRLGFMIFDPFTFDTLLASLETTTSEGGQAAQLELFIAPSTYVPHEPTAGRRKRSTSASNESCDSGGTHSKIVSLRATSSVFLQLFPCTYSGRSLRSDRERRAICGLRPP